VHFTDENTVAVFEEALLALCETTFTTIKVFRNSGWMVFASKEDDRRSGIRVVMEGEDCAAVDYVDPTQLVRDAVHMILPAVGEPESGIAILCDVSFGQDELDREMSAETSRSKPHGRLVELKEDAVLGQCIARMGLDRTQLRLFVFPWSRVMGNATGAVSLSRGKSDVLQVFERPPWFLGRRTITATPPVFHFRMGVDFFDDLSNNNLLGRGSFGDVYRVAGTGNHPAFRKGAVYAVKIAPKARAREISAEAAEFQHEVMVMKKLAGCYSCVHALGTSTDETDCVNAVLMPAYDTTLYEYVTTRFREYHHSSTPSWFSRFEVGRWMAQIAQALCYMHNVGLAHLDLKPQNVLLRLTGTQRVQHVAVCDYGTTVDGGVVASPTVLIKGIVGTPGFMAPEMRSQECKDVFSADVYSFGMLLAFVVSGITISENDADSLVDGGGSIRMPSKEGDTLDPEWCVERSVISETQRPPAERPKAVDLAPRLAMAIAHCFQCKVDQSKCLRRENSAVARKTSAKLQLDLPSTIKDGVQDPELRKSSFSALSRLEAPPNLRVVPASKLPPAVFECHEWFRSSGLGDVLDEYGSRLQHCKLEVLRKRSLPDLEKWFLGNKEAAERVAVALVKSSAVQRTRVFVPRALDDDNEGSDGIIAPPSSGRNLLALEPDGGAVFLNGPSTTLPVGATGLRGRKAHHEKVPDVSGSRAGNSKGEVGQDSASTADAGLGAAVSGGDYEAEIPLPVSSQLWMEFDRFLVDAPRAPQPSMYGPGRVDQHESFCAIELFPNMATGMAGSHGNFLVGSGEVLLPSMGSPQIRRGGRALSKSTTPDPLAPSAAELPPDLRPKTLDDGR
jgi:serine/threonine protein kinase